MSASIQIKTNKLYSESPKIFAFDEDITTSTRVGQDIIIPKPADVKLSGVTQVYASQLPENVTSSSIKIGLESKLVQGVSARNVSDLLGDFIPYMHMGSLEETYSQNVHERLTPFVKFNNLGYNEIVRKDIFRKFEDVATTKNQQHLYIESARDLNQKFYPQHSGSNYNSELNFNGNIEPFDIRNVIDIRKRMIGRGRVLKESKTNSIRGFYHGISCDIGCAGNNLKDTGCAIITNLTENKTNSENQSRFFNDAKNTTLISENLKVPQYDPQKSNTLISPYDDSFDYTKGKYDSFNDSRTEDVAVKKDVKRPYTRLSEVGTRFKSARTGFIYKNSSSDTFILGTDSIAYGGLKGDSSA